MLPKYKSQIFSIFWNSCVNEALDALSKMIRKNVKITNSSIEIELLNNVPKLMNPKETTTTLVYTRISNSLNSVIIFSSPLKHFLKLVDILLNKNIDYYDALDDENKPLILELGNIMNGYFVSSMNRLFNTKFEHEVTDMSTNPFRSVEDFKFGNLYTEKINVLVFRSDFKVESEDIEGKLFLLTEEKKTDMVLEEISKKLKMI